MSMGIRIKMRMKVMVRASREEDVGDDKYEDEVGCG